MKKILLIPLLTLLCVAAYAQGTPYLSADSFWQANNKTCNVPPAFLNFDPTGLSSAQYGMKLIDTLTTTRYIRSYVNRDQPKIGLNYRDEFKLRTIELGDTSLNLQFFHFIYQAVDYVYDNRNSLMTQWKYGQFYPQVSDNIRPIGGQLMNCIVIQTDTTTPGTTAPLLTKIYPYRVLESNRDVNTTYQFNWQSNYTGWVKVFVDGTQQKFNINGVMMDSIPGANMDTCFNVAHRSYPPWRVGGYQFTWGDLPTPPAITVRTILFRNVIVGGTDMNISQFMPAVAATPYLIFSDTTLSVAGYTEGSGPAIGTLFTVRGNKLTPAASSITLTAPTDYELSTSSANTGFGGSVLLAYTGSNFGVQNVWVRLKAGVAAGSYNEVVSVSGGGTAYTIDVSATVAPLPVIPPVSTTNIGYAPIIFTN